MKLRKRPKQPCLSGFQLNVLEPYDVKLLWYNDSLAELHARYYRWRRITRAPGMLWECKLDKTTTLRAVSLDRIFDAVVAWLDEHRHKPVRVECDDFPVRFSVEKCTNSIWLDDDANLEVAAVSLGMGSRMLPSNRYGSRDSIPTKLHL